MGYKYLFGPVPSRRLGRSLGIDLVPFKTCSLNCVYCECGETTVLTTERKAYVPAAEVIDELRAYMDTQPELDFLTFSGSGEPTLHSGIGEIIAFIKTNYPTYKVAVLTNGTLLDRSEVRQELMSADVVVPSLDAVSMEVMEIINRPGSEVNVGQLISGITTFTREFPGEVWLEVFLLEGYNTEDDELQQLAETVRIINPKRVQINTLDRPGALSGLKPASIEIMIKFAELTKIPNGKVYVEIVAKVDAPDFTGLNVSNDVETAILLAVSRRPMTLEDLELVLKQPRTVVKQYIENLFVEHKIIKDRGPRGEYYGVTNPS